MLNYLAATEEQVVIQTYKDLNYNAECDDCYVLLEVEEVIRTYHVLVEKGTVPKWKPGSSDNTLVINVVAMNTENASNQDDRARVAAMLYQYYYTNLRLNGEAKKTNPVETSPNPVDTKPIVDTPKKADYICCRIIPGVDDKIVYVGIAGISILVFSQIFKHNKKSKKEGKR